MRKHLKNEVRPEFISGRYALKKSTMDFFSILLAVVVGVAIFVYSMAAVGRVGVAAYFNAVGTFAKAITVAFGKLIANFVGLLAASAKTSDSNDASANAVRGGVLNYRTGKLDDGTDPVGWYEKD